MSGALSRAPLKVPFGSCGPWAVLRHNMWLLNVWCQAGTRKAAAMYIQQLRARGERVVGSGFKGARKLQEGAASKGRGAVPRKGAQTCACGNGVSSRVCQ